MPKKKKKKVTIVLELLNSVYCEYGFQINAIFMTLIQLFEIYDCSFGDNVKI